MGAELSADLYCGVGGGLGEMGGSGQGHSERIKYLTTERPATNLMVIGEANCFQFMSQGCPEIE